MKLNNTFAIGCLIQWYEIELVGEYLQSVKNSLDVIDNKENVVIDLYFNCDQSLEKLDKNQTDITKIKNKYNSLLKSIFDYDEDYPYGNYNIKLYMNEHSDKIYTIADYRRDFNNKY